jgi:hypothetical protein
MPRRLLVWLRHKQVDFVPPDTNRSTSASNSYLRQATMLFLKQGLRVSFEAGLFSRTYRQSK